MLDQEYVETEYWNKRTTPNGMVQTDKKKETTKRHIAYVKKHVKGSLTILDFGVGVGRVFPAYDGIREVYGYDISNLYIEAVSKKAEEHDFRFHHVIGNTPAFTPFNGAEFDKAVCVSVLLHQTPKMIVGVMRELIRVSDEVVVVSWFDRKKNFAKHGNKKKQFEYCFNYDFYKICKEEGWYMDDVVEKGGHIYFVYGEEAET